MKKNLLCASLLLLAGAFACQKKVDSSVSSASQTDSSSVVSIVHIEPIEELDVPTRTYSLMAEKGGQIKLDNGTEIIVPANAFQDEQGTPVTGKVDIQYREMHSIVDVIGSGIPMTFNDHGNRKNFVTAGMFEINGFSAGKNVSIAPDKSIQVNMASFNPSTEANFYVLERKTMQWKYVSESKIVAIPQSKKALNRAKPIEGAEPILPERADEEAFKFDIQVDLKKFPELRTYRDVIWQYVPSENPEFTNPETVENFYGEPWISVQLENFGKGKETYKLTLVSKKRTFTSLVKPVLGDRSFAKAKKEYEQTMKVYDDLILQETARLAQRAAIQRQITLTSFGTYNHDLFYNAKEQVIAKASIQFQDNQGVKSNLPSYLVIKSRNAVINYSESGYDNYNNFTFDKADKNALVVMLPGKKIAVFDTEDFKKAQNGEKTYVFNVDQPSVEIANVKDLSKVIGQL